MPTKLTIEEMNKIARKKQGKCLAETYVNNRTKLIWECSKGHRWKATPANIKREKWCPYCKGKYKTIKDIHKLAQEHGGKCQSPTYTNSITKLKWQCANGHIWRTTPFSVKQHSWCPVCAKEKRKLKGGLGIEPSPCP
jgi:glutaredoxin